MCQAARSTISSAQLRGFCKVSISRTISARIRVHPTIHTRKMSEDKAKSRITSWAGNDGQFKRQVSAFQDHIQEGGKFAPEKGMPLIIHALLLGLTDSDRPIPPVCQLGLPLGPSDFDREKVERAGRLYWFAPPRTTLGFSCI